jgi:hypothetical protein
MLRHSSRSHQYTHTSHEPRRAQHTTYPISTLRRGAHDRVGEMSQIESICGTASIEITGVSVLRQGASRTFTQMRASTRDLFFFFFETRPVPSHPSRMKPMVRWYIGPPRPCLVVPVVVVNLRLIWLIAVREGVIIGVVYFYPLLAPGGLARIVVPPPLLFMEVWEVQEWVTANWAVLKNMHHFIRSRSPSLVYLHRYQVTAQVPQPTTYTKEQQGLAHLCPFHSFARPQ